MDFLGTILAVILVGLLTFILYLRRKHGTLEKIGIPVHKPFLFLGSPPFLWHEVNVHDFYLDMSKKYGLTWGRYQGITPVINTIDPAILKSIFTTNFDCFTDTFGNTENYAYRHMTLDMLGGDTWRALRQIISPSFTSGKLKAMTSLIADSVRVTVEQLKNADGEKVNLKILFQEMALDVACKCGLGVHVPRPLDPTRTDCVFTNMATDLANAFLVPSTYYSVAQQVTFHLPWFERFFPFFNENFDNVFYKIKQIVRHREKMSDPGKDFLGRLVESKANLKENHGLHEDTLDTQATLFLLGGTETVATMMTKMFYCLATNPKIQDKLCEELQGYLSDHDGQVNKDELASLPLLDAVINETMRLFPPITQHQRICTKDCVVDGLQFKKDMMIHIPIYASHRWDKFFEDPDTFKPERFFKDNAEEIQPFTYRPFGGGPRTCIGQRFALAEIKQATALILPHIKLVAEKGMKLDFLKGDMFLLNTPSVNIQVYIRK